MQTYELTYLISPELKEEELKDFSQKIGSLISKVGKNGKSEAPKRITLAYPIQKKRGAFLATFEFSAEPKEAENLKKELAKEKQILRFLLIKKRGLEEIKEKLKPAFAKAPASTKVSAGKEKPIPEKKVELKEIEEKLEKILDFPREDEPQAKSER